MRIRIPPIVLATAVAALLATVAVASAITPVPKMAKTTLAMSEKFPAFHGKLHSSDSNCIADRKVRLYREKHDGSGKLLGTDRSEDDGTWAIPIGDKLIGGAYYATVAAKSSTELSLLCKAAKSQVAVVD